MPVERVAAAPALNWPNVSPPVIATAEGPFIRILLEFMAAERVVVTQAIYVGRLSTDRVRGLVLFGLKGLVIHGWEIGSVIVCTEMVESFRGLIEGYLYLLPA
jgi:hypothetical protein